MARFGHATMVAVSTVTIVLMLCVTLALVAVWYDTHSVPQRTGTAGPVVCSEDGQEDGRLVDCSTGRPLNWNGEAWYRR